MDDTTTVFVVNDDEQVRESLAAPIESMGLAVTCFTSGRDFLDRYTADARGCVVLDLKMPQVSGLEVIESLRSRGITVPIIMISGHGDISAAVSAMKAARDRLSGKAVSRRGADGEHSPGVDLDARQRVNDEKRSHLAERFARLTPNEREVLDLTAAGKPDKAIALKLDLSLRTIQLHRASLMRKLEVRSRAELIRLAQAAEQQLAGAAERAAQYTNPKRERGKPPEWSLAALSG